MKVLVKKSFGFVDEAWCCYKKTNLTVMRYTCTCLQVIMNINFQCTCSLPTETHVHVDGGQTTAIDEDSKAA